MVDPNFFQTGSRRPRSGRGRLSGTGQLVIALVILSAAAVSFLAANRFASDHDVQPSQPAPSGVPVTLAGASQSAGIETTTTPPAAAPSGPAEAAPMVEVTLAAADRVTARAQKLLADKLAEAQAMIGRKEFLAARVQLMEVVDKGLPAEANAKAVAAAEQAAAETILSPVVTPNDRACGAFTVPQGGVLATIARRHKVQAALLLKINGLDDARKLRAEQTIKVVHGPFNAVVDKSDFTLTVYLDVAAGEGKPRQAGVLVRRFKVGLGEHNSTPAGAWTTESMLVNPPYVHPRTGKPIKPGEPDYPFGDPGRWIRLKGLSESTASRSGYGIHGTVDPDSIGKQQSLGCVRMLNEDVVAVDMFLRPGVSRVTIRE